MPESQYQTVLSLKLHSQIYGVFANLVDLFFQGIILLGGLGPGVQKAQILKITEPYE